MQNSGLEIVYFKNTALHENQGANHPPPTGDILYFHYLARPLLSTNNQAVDQM